MNAFSNFANNNQSVPDTYTDRKTDTNPRKIPPSETGHYINYPTYYSGTAVPSTLSFPDSWVQVPIYVENIQNRGMCSLYIKNSIAAEIANVQNTIVGAMQLLIEYSKIYNTDIRAYLTGYSDQNNFKIEARMMGCTVNIILYCENGLLNVVASYTE